MRVDLLNALQVETKERDAYQRTLGDVLDVKASIIMVTVTFLATIARGVLVDEHVRTFIRVLQVVGVFALIASAVLATLVLLPANYLLPPSAGDTIKWAKRLKGKNDDEIYEKFAAGTIVRAQQRTLENGRINLLKSDYLNGAFRLMLIALVIELVTLIWLPFQR